MNNMKDERLITEELLKSIGFEDTTFEWEKDYWNKALGIDNYCTLTYLTDNEDGSNFIKLDFKKGIVNWNANWGLHIDNNAYESIGSADISYVWQFNMLMEIFGSKFRL